MRRFLPATAFVALAANLLAQTSVPLSSKEDAPDSSCIVSGRVLTASEGSPLKSARVALEPEDSRSNNHLYAVTSDGEGRFLLKDVPPGRYHFLPHAGVLWISTICLRVPKVKSC